MFVVLQHCFLSNLDGKEEKNINFYANLFYYIVKRRRVGFCIKLTLYPHNQLLLYNSKDKRINVFFYYLNSQSIALIFPYYQESCCFSGSGTGSMAQVPIVIVASINLTGDLTTSQLEGARPRKRHQL